MKILITGGAGFIGSRLAEALIGHDHEVTIVDNLSTGRRENAPKGAKLVVGDIRDPRTLFGSWDVIYHAAASYKDRDNWERDASTNVDGTINVVRVAQHAGCKLVYFQTSLCYGLAPESPVQLDAPLDPHGSYAVSKTAAECYIRDSGVDFVSLRLANMYGPRNLSGPVPSFYKRISEGQPCTVVDTRRDFVFVDDLVWVAVKAATVGHGVYHVASGSDVSIETVWQLVADAIGEPSTYTRVPRQPDDVATILLDPTETEAAFGWKARTPLTTGILAAVRWYQEFGVTATYSHLKGVADAR